MNTQHENRKSSGENILLAYEKSLNKFYQTLFLVCLAGVPRSLQAAEYRFVQYIAVIVSSNE
jgi:hypothetical protein